jgi:SpoVK/Ycf46/Vps4 family AAA+-type ATPase
VGAPDLDGRQELASELLPAADPEAVAASTAGFTPADFALVAQRAAQAAFDRALAGGDPAPTEADVKAAIEATRPSVSAEDSDRFDAEASLFSRL